MHNTPVSAVPVVCDVGRYAPAVIDSVHGHVQRVQRFEQIERLRIVAEHVANERRTATLVRQYDKRLRFSLVKFDELRMNRT